MEEILKLILKEQQKSNELLESVIEHNGNEKDLDEMLEPKEIQKQYNLPEGAVYKMFADKNFAALRYTKPMKASRRSVNEYLSRRHEKKD